MIDPYSYDELAARPMCGICCKRAPAADLTEWRHYPDCAWLHKWQQTPRGPNYSSIGLVLLINVAFWGAVAAILTQ